MMSFTIDNLATTIATIGVMIYLEMNGLAENTGIAIADIMINLIGLVIVWNIYKGVSKAVLHLSCFFGRKTMNALTSVGF